MTKLRDLEAEAIAYGARVRAGQDLRLAKDALLRLAAFGRFALSEKQQQDLLEALVRVQGLETEMQNARGAYLGKAELKEIEGEP